MHESLNLLMGKNKLKWKQCVTNRNIVGSVDCCDKESVTNKNVCILLLRTSISEKTKIRQNTDSSPKRGSVCRLTYCFVDVSKNISDLYPKFSRSQFNQEIKGHTVLICPVCRFVSFLNSVNSL